VGLLGALLSGGSASLRARPAVRRSEPARYAIFGSESASHRLNRRLIAFDEKHRYQIFTAVPKQLPSEQGFPIIYMLDGNAVFDRLTPEILAANAGLMIAAIGYPTAMTIDTLARSRDYTPPLPDGRSGDSRDQGRPTGGAPGFLALLQGQLRCAVETGYAVDSSRRALWGHSYGGLFCLYTLLTEPDAFSRYVAVSPSCNWGDEWLLHLSKQASRRNVAAYGEGSVLVMLGDSEVRSGSGNPTPGRPAPSTMTLIEALRQREDLRVAEHIFTGMGHGATFAASFPRALSLAGT